ncbi:hypothetical protein RQP46_009281 [Phenoliferia psychrophenolica]
MDRVHTWLNDSSSSGEVRAHQTAASSSRNAAVIDLATSEPASPAASSVLSVHSVPDRTAQNPFKHNAPLFNKPRPVEPKAAVVTQQRTGPLAPIENKAASPQAIPMSAKERATALMHAEHQRLDLPKPLPKAIAVPQNAPYRAPGAAAPDEDEEALKEAMNKLDIGENLSAVDQEAALKTLLESAMDLTDVDTTGEPPAGLVTKLFPHQILGLHWLKDRESGKKRGGILGDDMGLGKTVQMIALILALKPPAKPKTTLIVCPVGLMDQWKNEIEKHSDGSLRVAVHHGPKRETEARRLRKYDVLITSYNTAAAEWVDPKPKKGKGKGKKKGSDDDNSGTEDTKECGALFDTSVDVFHRTHTIKGRGTRGHKACCDLRAKYRWCLTGTPVQNEVMDLFSLFEFLGKVVKPLNEFSEFKARIADPLKNKRAKVAMARLVLVLKSVMLRRTKTMLVDGKPLLDLPGREIINIKTDFLYHDERVFYHAVEEKMELEMNAFMKAGTAMSNYTSVLTLLLRMRQACSHPALVTGTSITDLDALDPEVQKQKPASTEDTLDDLIGGLDKLAVEAPVVACVLCEKPAEEASAYCEGCAEQGAKYGSLKFSTKIRTMIGKLEEIRAENPKRKTIVFSQFTSMFNIIEPFLKEGKFKFVRFDGSMDVKKKAEAIDKITNNPSTTVILISIKAGSVGLNLTACSRVILMDLWWNPAIESQAFDRAHRMGQKEDVKIYKITVTNTVEDRILTLQDQKAKLAKACLEGGSVKGAAKLTMKDMLYLFRSDGAES